MKLSLAAPAITGVSGNMIDGNTIMIQGSGFGASGPNIILFDDFEGISGQDIPLTSPKVGSWTSYKVRGYPNYRPKYHAVYHSPPAGFQIIDTTKSTASMSDAIDQQFRKVFTPTSEVFISYWVRIPDGTCFPWYHNETCVPATFPSGGSRWKFTWLMYGESGFGGDGTLDLCLPTWATMFAVAGNDNLGSGTWWLDNTWWSWTSWNRITHWIKPNLSNPSDSTGYLWMQRVSIEKGNSVVSRNNTQIFPTNDPNKVFDRINFPGWLGNSSFTNVDPAYDDIYIATGANSIARVEIGNAATYTASNRVAIATPTSWSGTSISATLRQGDFQSGETAYLYVVDSNNIVNTQGYPITISGTPPDPDTTPPILPENFNLTASSTSQSSITVSWNPATDPAVEGQGTSGVAGYIIERCLGLSCSDFAQVGSPTSSPFTDTDLSASTGYSYHVRARDAAGNLSGWSNVVGATTQPATPAPTFTLTANPTSITSGQSSTLTWSAVTNATSCTASGGTFTGSKSTSGGTQSVSPTATTTYSLSCTGAGGTTNRSATVTVSGGNCSTSSLYPTFGSQSLTAQMGAFTLEFDAIPAQNNMDGVMGLSNGAATTWSSFAAAVRFNPSGFIDVRNGGAFQAVTTVNYQAGTSYHVRMEVNVSNHTYSVFVKPSGQTSEQTLANQYAFRTEQASVSQLDTLAYTSEIGSETVCNVSVVSTAFTACNTVNTENFSQSAYNAYGAPYDLFASNAQLVDAKCTSADTHTINATIGKTGDTTRIVYTKGYYFDPGINNWAEYSSTCTGTLNGDWCAGPTTATITDPDLSTASKDTPAYFVGMVCSVQGGGWKCGCRDTNCTNFYWQIQGAGME